MALTGTALALATQGAMHLLTNVLLQSDLDKKLPADQNRINMSGTATLTGICRILHYWLLRCMNLAIYCSLNPSHIRA